MPRHSPRRWRLPAGLVREPGGPLLEGAAVLSEWPSALAVLLWQTSAHVLLWTRTPVERRPLVFGARMANGMRRWLRRAETLPSGISFALESIAAALSSGTATESTARTIGVACEAVSRWAEEKGKAGTAMEFAICAALVLPESAKAALELGRLAVLHDRTPARGVTWLRRAGALARLGGEWPVYVEAFRLLGRLALESGETKRAQPFLVRSLRRLHRHGIKGPVRWALLAELFRLALRLKRFRHAKQVARYTLARGGGVNGELAAELWAGLARIELIERGRPGRAFLRAQALLADRRLPARDRLRLLTLTARVRAGNEDVAGVAAVSAEAWELLTRAPRDADALVAALDLQYAAGVTGRRTKQVRARMLVREIAAAIAKRRVPAGALGPMEGTSDGRPAPLRALVRRSSTRESNTGKRSRAADTAGSEPR